MCDKSACLPFLSIPPNLPSPSLSSPLSHSFLPVSFCSRLSNCGCQLLQSLCCCCCGATPAKCPAQSPSLFSPPSLEIISGSMASPCDTVTHHFVALCLLLAGTDGGIVGVLCQSADTRFLKRKRKTAGRGMRVTVNTG